MSDEGARWEAVDSYAKSRSSTIGDIYGWSKVGENMTRPRALLLISEDAPRASFPDEIAGIQIELLAVPEPEGQEA